jgi:pyruvate-ferredoxin/flavodoxin oxidoreductase
LGARINTIMQTCFFAISGVLPKDEAIQHIKKAIEKTYGKKGPKVVQSNFAAVDAALKHLYFVDHGNVPTAPLPLEVEKDAAVPDFVERVTRVMLRNQGDRLPVSAFPVDGVWPTGTTKYEKRNIAQEIPKWDPDLCIQCNKCAFVCPHAAVRAKFYPESCAEEAPPSFQWTPFRSKENKGYAFTIQVAPEDCTGCTICVDVCPGKDRKNPERKALMMTPQAPVREQERKNFDFFVDLPQPRSHELDTNLKGSQFRQPLFEFSGACAGCGETPYIKLLTQLYGDRLLMANATGCSSIFGGNLPTTPYTTNEDGRGPAWANSLFEDNAEFGLGLRLSVDQRARTARRLLRELSPKLHGELVQELLNADQSSDTGIAMQRERVKVLRQWLGQVKDPVARELEQFADFLVEKSVWIVGGDGWAYDIGFGGLDHVLASGANVNVLVLDTGTYSNTGGQQSKATPMGAVAKFAAAGKALPKKDLGMQAMMYGHIYVAQVALGAKDTQTVQAFNEAASYEGPSLIIAYAHCVSHGFGLDAGLAHQKAAVQAGVHPLYRFDPRKLENGQPVLRLDSKKPSMSLAEFMANEGRFQMLKRRDPERAESLCGASEEDIRKRYEILEGLSK